MATFAIGFTEVAVLVSVCLVFQSPGMSNGGPALMVWSFVACSFCTVIIAWVMADICAAYPSAGSVYHWTAQIVPEKWAPLASYICGWWNFLGNTAGDASFAAGFAAFLSSALVASGYDKIPAVHQVWVAILVLLLWSLLNCFRIEKLAFVNNFAAVCHVASILLVIIGCLVCAGQPGSTGIQTGSFVFGGYYNDSGWDDTVPVQKGYLLSCGIVFSIFLFAGFEAPAHMAEETLDADVVAPRGLINTVYATAIGGFLLIICLLFCTFDIPTLNAAVTETLEDGTEQTVGFNTGIMVVEIFLWTTKTSCPGLGVAMVWLVVINFFMAGLASVCVTGRITFAFARDGAFPLSEFWALVIQPLQIPIPAIFLVFILDVALLLLQLNEEGGAAAFAAIVGLCSIGFNISYGIPIFLKLVCKPANFPVTPYAIHRHLATPFGILSCIWLFGTSALCFFPAHGPVTADNGHMQWLCVVVAAVFVVAALNWIFNSRKHFKGPARVGDKPRHSTQKSESRSEGMPKSSDSPPSGAVCI